MLWFDPHGVAQCERIDFDLTWIFPRELELLLNRHGMTIDAAFGDYDGSPIRSYSPRIIASIKAKS